MQFNKAIITKKYNSGVCFLFCQVPSLQLECLTNYIDELSLLEYNMLCYALCSITNSHFCNFSGQIYTFPFNQTMGMLLISNRSSTPVSTNFNFCKIDLLFLFFATEFHVAALHTLTAFWSVFVWRISTVFVVIALTLICL